MAPKPRRPSPEPQQASDAAPSPRPADRSSGQEALAGSDAFTAAQGSDEGAQDFLPADLTFRQAQTALELILSLLQADDLDIEVMVDLHRRAEAYADHCERLLQQVEQEVMQWNPEDPDTAPAPYTP